MTYPVFSNITQNKKLLILCRTPYSFAQKMLIPEIFSEFNQSFFDQLTSILNTRLAACIQKTNLPDGNAKTCKL